MKPTYRILQKHIAKNGVGGSSHPLLLELFSKASNVLDAKERETLNSKVEGKSYFAFGDKNYRSRPIESSLFSDSSKDTASTVKEILAGNRANFTSEEITSNLYTFAITLCAAQDVSSKGDRKTQGTMFEYVCAAVMRSALGITPTRKLEILNLDLKGDLPTDYVFDLGAEQPKFHFPVKTSTRERVIQVWAHQRVLDGVYGVGRFLATPFILTETKLNNKTNEVIEICLPWQWRLYQMHIATIWNFCFFDAPKSYLALDNVFPRVPVSTIGDFLVEGGRLDGLLETLKP